MSKNILQNFKKDYDFLRSIPLKGHLMIIAAGTILAILFLIITDKNLFKEIFGI